MDQTDRRSAACVLEAALDDERNHMGGAYLSPTLACFLEHRIAAMISYVRTTSSSDIPPGGQLDMH